MRNLGVDYTSPPSSEGLSLMRGADGGGPSLFRFNQLTHDMALITIQIQSASYKTLSKRLSLILIIVNPVGTTQGLLWQYLLISQVGTPSSCNNVLKKTLPAPLLYSFMTYIVCLPNVSSKNQPS